MCELNSMKTTIIKITGNGELLYQMHAFKERRLTQFNKDKYARTQLTS